MGKKKTVVERLEALMLGKQPAMELPTGKILFCLNCRTWTSYLYTDSALCFECRPKMKSEDVHVYKKLVQIHQFESYPTEDFANELSTFGLNREILEAYFKSFGLQANATGSSLFLSANQRGRNLNILFQENNELFKQSVKNLLNARRDAEFHAKAAKAESNKFLQDQFAVDFEQLKNGALILDGFDIKIPEEYQSAKKQLAKAVWNREFDSAQKAAGTLLNLLAMSQKVRELETEIAQKHGFRYSDVKVGQEVISNFEIKSLNELCLQNTGLGALLSLRNEGDQAGEQKYISILKDLAQVPQDFNLLTNENGFTPDQRKMAQDTARTIISTVAIGEQLEILKENPFLVILKSHADFLETSPEDAIRRFIAIVRTFVDVRNEHHCGTWVYYLLVKSRPTLWLQLMDNFIDPDHWMFRAHCFPNPKASDEPSSIPDWGYGPPALSSLGAGWSSGRRYR